MKEQRDGLWEMWFEFSQTLALLMPLARDGVITAVVSNVYHNYAAVI